MVYSALLASGHRIEIENVGDSSTISISISGGGQQQSQRAGFGTGAWVKEPELFQTSGAYVIRMQTSGGVWHFALAGGQVQQLSGAPSLVGAQSIPLTESWAVPPTPMPPMDFGDFLGEIKPGEMRMGNMVMTSSEMRMGDMTMSFKERESERVDLKASKFCTQCGQGVGPEDRFCGGCGHRLAA